MDTGPARKRNSFTGAKWQGRNEEKDLKGDNYKIERERRDS